MTNVGICVFITNTCDVSTANESNMLELLSNHIESTQLQMELVIIVNVEDIFVNKIYNLQGDVPLALSTYELISFLSTFVTTVHYPNTAIFWA